ncbi:MAG: 4-hydroxy-tetrahydrodipicolinate reductase [Bacteroidetes bacterium]|nr:4-hydroxy-tetrahydrodipicolinate reductase [Bacteroidota bacterium]
MNIAIIGYGKMGKVIEGILLQRGHSVGVIIDVNNQDDFNKENFKNIDVAIEFTAPTTAFNNITKCLKFGVPVVCGTTAWLDKYDEVAELCKKVDGAFFYSSNYSIGVNLFFKVNKHLAKMMNGFSQYDVSVEEVHHTQKKDSPSGTAVTIAEGILEGIDRKEKWVGETTIKQNELEVLGIRRSVVPGTHTVTWESPVDSIRIEHMAKGREGFALGAIVAAEFLAGKKGVYTMDDLMKF